MCNIALSSPNREVWWPLPSCICQYLPLLIELWDYSNPDCVWECQHRDGLWCGHPDFLTPACCSGSQMTSSHTFLCCLLSYFNWLINRGTVFKVCFQKATIHPSLIHTISVLHLLTKTREKELEQGRKMLSTLLASIQLWMPLPSSGEYNTVFWKTFQTSQRGA